MTKTNVLSEKEEVEIAKRNTCIYLQMYKQEEVDIDKAIKTLDKLIQQSQD